jgi:hypothetical protein
VKVLKLIFSRRALRWLRSFEISAFGKVIRGGGRAAAAGD